MSLAEAAPAERQRMRAANNAQAGRVSDRLNRYSLLMFNNIPFAIHTATTDRQSNQTTAEREEQTEEHHHTSREQTSGRAAKHTKRRPTEFKRLWFLM